MRPSALPSIWEALQICGANRLGHGVRIIDDIMIGEDGRPALGDLAAYVRNQRVPLEMCPTSNVQTGAAASIAEHPIGLLADLRFRVTVNTDNQLMSRTTLSREFDLLSEAFDYDRRRALVHGQRGRQRLRPVRDADGPRGSDHGGD